MNDERSEPRQYLGVMVSSTFTDLEQHRAALMKAIEAQGLYAVAMEHDAALPDGTVIDSSLRKVHEASAYIGVISHKYGQVPDSPQGNPSGYSLTELEFREARRLGRPILIFIMGEDHDVKRADVERDPEKTRKLDAFREEVKRAAADSSVQRVYQEFNSLHEFEVAATQSIAELRRLLDGQRASALTSRPDDADEILAPPALYAEPRYIGSHAFVGRAAELQTLSGWAAPEDPHPMLLFEAIGGTGKSMLTWEWTLKRANAARADWAGTFWYSFYEKGAVMADFCRRALAYMTGQPLKTFGDKRQAELSDLLLRQLQARPWLLVLDGLERVLVAYHRYDAAQVADEEAGRTDEIAHRDPAAAIRPQDDDLLRRLADATPSKILVTSRLVPQSLVNQASQSIPGVRHERLTGLRPADAEALLRACGVRGDSQRIQSYLERHCDCHPLVTGIVAGLVHDYLPARGHFDAWAADPAHGGQLDLARLDLVQKRNHILHAAIDALSREGRQLLSALALLSEAVDYDVLAGLNPHLPPQGRPLSESAWPGESSRRFASISGRWVAVRRARHERSRQAWLQSPDHQVAIRELSRTVRDLERRALLQYDRQADRYDLHPVVRGYASSRLQAADRNQVGQWVVDYFSQQVQDPYAQAETLDDVWPGLQLVRTLLQMGRPQEAYAAYTIELSNALTINLEAYAEILSLLRPFFAADWSSPTVGLGKRPFVYLATEAYIALHELGQVEQSLALNEATLGISLVSKSWGGVRVGISNIAESFEYQNYLARHARHVQMSLDLAELLDDADQLFRARLDQFQQYVITGRLTEAEESWRVLDPMGRDWRRRLYRPGEAELSYAQFQFERGVLTEAQLRSVEDLAKPGRNRPGVRGLHMLRAEWRLERQEWALAAESLHEAIRMTREADMDVTYLEILLARARLRLGRLPAGRDEAVRLSGQVDGSKQRALAYQRVLAELWLALGDPARAADHARAAYRWAWADGEPYVRAYELAQATSLLSQLGVEIPVLPAYDPSQDQPSALEEELRAAIRNLRGTRRGPRPALSR